MDTGWSLKNISAGQLVQELMERENAIVNHIGGTFRQQNGFSFHWELTRRLSGLYELTTNDPDSDCCVYHGDAFASESPAECLAHLAQIIKAVSCEEE